MSCEDAAVGDLLPLFVDLLRTLHAQLAVAIPVRGCESRRILFAQYTRGLPLFDTCCC